MTSGGNRAAGVFLAALLALTCPGIAQASDLVPDPLGVIRLLPDGPRDHWVWVSDRLFRHNLLFDGDSGRVLGTLDVASSLGGRIPLTSATLHEFYVVESVYTRGHRGERHDFVTIYDAATLAAKGEIEIPPLAAETGAGVALTAILDGGDVLLVYNQNPSSVSVADVVGRRLAGTVDVAGCAGVYPTGARSFASLCGDGTVIQVFLDDAGKQQSMHRSEVFFDALEDPVTEKGVRRGQHWLFASFNGRLHEVDFSGAEPQAGEAWSLFSEGERSSGWRVGGVQHLALHARSGRLYSFVHRGGPGSHKDPGEEIWVYDLASKSRVQTIPVPNLLPAFVRPLLGIERESLWFRALEGVLSWLPGPGAHSMAVTQDAEPLLFVRNADIGALGVIDAMSGTRLREIEEAGLSGANLGVP